MTSRKTRLNRSFTLAVCTAVLALQGCALPGFEAIGSSRIASSSSSAARPHVLGYAPVVETAADMDGVPEGAITPITPSLISAMVNATPKTVPEDVRALFGKPPVYTIGPGDVISITVYDHPELLPNAGAVISQSSDPTGVSVAPGFIVSSTGEVSFPYVGRIRMAGLTEIEASDLITQRIAKYIKDPQVSVRIASFRSRRAYVEGEVRTPGIQIFTDVPMTLAEAINRAGGILSTGDRAAVTLTRAERTTVINLAYLRDIGADANSIPLQNGDIIDVRSRDESKVYVMGEIAKPSALLMRNGKLSLNEALGEAGGPSLTTASTGQIYVIRKGSQASTQVFHLDAKNPTALALADRFGLQARDVVYIDPVGLVQWNRFISLILPAAQVVDLGSQAATR